MYIQGFEHRETALLDYTKQYITKQANLVGKSIRASVHRRWKVWLSKLESFFTTSQVLRCATQRNYRKTVQRFYLLLGL
jgi:hypothetical protein